MQTLKKSSQIIRRKELEYVLELDGGPIMPHTIPLMVEFIRRTGLCDDEQTVVRISDRAVCNGINEVDPELCDWNELRVDKEKVWWDKL
ncbi:hypothetical protein TELCIR_11170 [Teladorsagia circumcincta]|uniref:Uncharacterized protein n=1 Tax=Teladorsagia circumcincta TaxID=45464 RepID=A0A2G9U9Z8_TELCI|nr:hypothetical protein TELCIR_11170 [Teladorsagia circumcincta]